ncbi:MAG: hypothetical protein HZA46_25330 [Planctomycetales bacterium]|nr:hypothetical protein [Planctomycetales bacterium]
MSFDEWIGWEYAGVHRHYEKLELGDKTDNGVFNDPYKFNSVVTYELLRRHLSWPMRLRYAPVVTNRFVEVVSAIGYDPCALGMSVSTS